MGILDVQSQFKPRHFIKARQEAHILDYGAWTDFPEPVVAIGCDIFRIDRLEGFTAEIFFKALTDLVIESSGIGLFIFSGILFVFINGLDEVHVIIR